MPENVSPSLDNIDKNVVKQLEYYFGNINFPRDKFLQEQIKLDDGWVPVSTMLKFNRLAAICQDAEKIANAIANSGSSIVTISECKQKMRRNPENPLPENSLEYWQTIKHRTVYVKGFPLDSQLDPIMTWAAKFGEVENVLMRKVKQGDKAFKGSVFITYKTREDAENAQKSDEKYEDKELVKMMQDDYWTMKHKENKEAKAAHKALKAAKNAVESAEKEKAKHAVRFEKGLILAIDGLGEKASVDTVKTFFKQYGSVGYVAHENGSSTAEIRFNNDSEGGAQSAWDKATAAGENGKVIFQEKEISGKVLEGEDEEKYWTEFNTRKNNKQAPRGGRGGGRGGRGRGRGRGGNRNDNDRRGGKRAAEDTSDEPQAKRTVFAEGGGDE